MVSTIVGTHPFYCVLKIMVLIYETIILVTDVMGLDKLEPL